MGNFVHGSKAGALFDGRDLTRFTTDFNFTTDIDLAEQTCLMPDGGAKEHLYGNTGASAGMDGRLARSRAQLEREMAAVKGQEEGGKLYLQAPSGFDAGKPAVIFRTLKEKFSVKGGMTSVNSTGMSFIADGVARIAAMLLAPRVQGGSSVTRNEIQNIALGAGFSGNTIAINAQNGGVAQNITLGETMGQVQTKLALALNKTNGHIVATGTSTAAGLVNGATGGTIKLVDVSGVVQAGPVANAFDGNPATILDIPSDSRIIYDFGAGNGKVVKGYRFTAGGNVRLRLEGSLNGTFSDAVILFDNSGSPVNENANNTFVNTVAYRAYRLRNGEGFTINLRDAQLLVDGSPAFDIDVAFSGASVAGINHPQIVSPTVGIVSTTPQEGGAVTGLNLITNATTFPWVKTAEAATTTGATIDLHAPFTSTGTLSVPVIIEHSADGVTVSGTLATFAIITDAANRDQLAQRIVLPAGTTVHPWVRVRVPSLTGSASLGVALARKPS